VFKEFLSNPLDLPKRMRMKKILVIGAGLSSSSLIRYLLQHAASEKWQVTVADQSPELAKKKIKRSKNAVAVGFSIENKLQREQLIKEHDLVISLLPPSLHITAAKDCIKFGKHLLTASYISPAMQELDKAAQKAGVLLLNEMGLDPGIDHMSAMQLMQEIRKKGGQITSFKSFCGGLVAPEFDTNPWNYKFTWNPRNVIMAGNATATFTENKRVKFIPYNRIFEQTEEVKVKGYGSFEAYANRDSNGYIIPYGLQKAETVLRGTLRRKGYCASWNHLIKLGLTDDALQLPETLTWRELVDALLPSGSESIEKKLCNTLQIPFNGKEFKKLQWLGILESKALGIQQATPATALQKLLQEKWKLNTGELDMIVMQHQISYTLHGKSHQVKSSLVVKGEDETYTAMSKTVGLPMAIAAKLLLQGKIKSRGVQMPVVPEIYDPVLAELEQNGISFFEEHK
jgi:saccharopine dehydrogenase-like NADP-dependent oxidoreductase